MKTTKQVIDELQTEFKKHAIWDQNEIFQVLNSKWLEIEEEN